ncbi:MAG: amino acid adenylation domain-containing protein [Candidatus Tectimicrobiota bacterium]
MNSPTTHNAGAPTPSLPLCIPALLQWQASRSPEAWAILAPQRPPLTYSTLLAGVEHMVQALRRRGLHAQDRIALVLPNGPDLAVASLGVASGAIAMPLNPAYTAPEFQFYLTRPQVKALLIQREMPSPARQIAQAQQLQILELAPEPNALGLCLLPAPEIPASAPPAYAHPEDIAFVLHTSGTTSRPKSVPLTHANVCASAAHACAALALTEADRYLNVLPLFHVGGLVSGLLSSLMAGASVVCAPDFEATAFFTWLTAFRPTWYMGVPVIHQAILDQADQYREALTQPTLRFIRSPAAALSASVYTALETTFQVPVLRSYGVTEAVMVACNPLPPRQRKPGSVGVSVGPEIAIMDTAGQLLPAGETGEIVIRGPNVMRGYEQDPHANREAFQQGWFRTGDQGYLDTEGYLFITGRLQERINRGGEIMTPQEVDDVLTQHPAVLQAVTFAVPHRRWGEDVVTAVVLRPEATATAPALLRFAAQHLALFKLPSRILLVDAIPTGQTGKFQRRQLAEHFAADLATPDTEASPAAAHAPETPLEARLAVLWGTVLGRAQVGRDDNFFVLGGDSITAMQLLARLRDSLHVELSLRHFFEAPTVAEVARHLQQRQEETAPADVPALLPGSRQGPLPLSYAQQRLWFLSHLGHSQQPYNLLEVIRLRGPLQPQALEQSFVEMAWRHEILRTTFSTIADQPMQVIAPTPSLTVTVIDLQALSAAAQESQLSSLAQTAAGQPFDLAQGPLLRLLLLRLAPEEHVLILTMHHIISDGWSHGVLWRELAIYYQALVTAQPARLPALPIQYADFAQWQQALRGEQLDRQLAYWTRQLADVPVLQLPTDYARPAIPTFRGARHILMLHPTLAHTLRRLSQEQNVTLFMTLLAVFQTLLQRYSDQDDIAVGSLIANRGHVALEGLLGFLVNTLVLRSDLSGNPSFQVLLARVRQVTLAAYEHQELPYEKLLEALRLPRHLSMHPLFQTMCVLHNTPRQPPALHGLSAETLEVDPGTARFDLTLDIWETPAGGLRCHFEYSTDLFTAATITRMAGHLQTLLEAVVADPTQPLAYLPLLTAAERHCLLVEWNATGMPIPEATSLPSLFEQQAERSPTAVALIDGALQLTYDDLNRRANQLAHYLQARGVSSESLVGLCIERSSTMVVGLLGILKAGAAYVPLDPTYPIARLTFMLHDAQPVLVLTQAHLAGRLPTGSVPAVCLDTAWPDIVQHSRRNPQRPAAPDPLAYVLYTSGSTGDPKGVMGLHRATLNALAWMWHAYPLAADEVCCHKTSISFGDSIQELFGPLLSGTPLLLIPDALLHDPLRFVRLLARHRVTRLILVPSLLRVLLDTVPDLQTHVPHLRLWFAGGEALPSDLWHAFRAHLPASRLINLYGASEASDDTTFYETSHMPTALPSVPIGRPIANTQVYVLDQHGQPVPLGVPGELYVGGASLTRGYLKRPALTAERFIPDPFTATPGARLYRTGDLVRYHADGSLLYLGRLDQQIKLRGIRIELPEVEAALARHPDVQATAVVVHQDERGEARLVAYIIPAREANPATSELRHWLATQLPMPMIPSLFVLRTDLPLTPSGKVDRRALAALDLPEPRLTESYVAPRTPAEHQIAALWGELLGLPQVGIYDDFFELGGHSLLAMQLVSRVCAAMQAQLSLLHFFEEPTVAGMAARLVSAGPQEPASLLRPVPRHEPLPAAIAQEAFWLFDQMFPGLPLFNIPYLVLLRGALDVTILEQCLHTISQRHESLRTTFVSLDGQLLQVIQPSLALTLRVADLRGVPAAERESYAQHLHQAESQEAFDLRQGPLWRASLLRLETDRYQLLVTLHHIISDGWSLGVLMQELTTLYEAFAAGRPAPLAPLSVHYADFAAWQRQWQAQPLMRAQLAYWRTQLHAPVPGTGLPLDHPRQSAFHIHVTRRHFSLSAALCAELSAVAQREGSTLFMVCLAALSMLLYGYTGQDDLCVATLVANRTRQETARMIGLLVNTVLLRIGLHGQPTCREVLQRVRATTLAASAHQDLPFEELLRVLEHEHPLQRASLCQVMLVWQHADLWPQECSTATLTFQTLEQSIIMPDVALTTFDMIITLREGPQGMTGRCLYKTELYEATTIDTMLDDLQGLLRDFSTTLGQPLEMYRTLRNRPS